MPGFPFFSPPRDEGPDLNLKDDDNCTPLHVAILNGAISPRHAAARHRPFTHAALLTHAAPPPGPPSL